MNRSQAVKIISDIICEVTYKELAEKRAIRILDELEKVGMLPPKNFNKYDPAPTITLTGNLDYSYIREWEPEES